MKKVLLPGVAGLVALALYCAGSAVSYWFVNGQYEALIREKPRTKEDLERRLSIYSQREIETKDSLWGSRRVLREGQRMVQYNILGFEPIDVIYDEADRVVEIISSYE